MSEIKPVYLCLSSEVFDEVTPKFVRNYKNELEQFERFGVPVLFSSEKPFTQALVDCNKFLHRKALIVSNNGAYAQTQDGKVVVDQKIPKQTIEALTKLFGDLGDTVTLSVSTLSKNVPLKPKTGFFNKIKKLFKKEFQDKNFEQASNNAYGLNIEFNTLGAKLLTQVKPINKNGASISDRWKIENAYQEQIQKLMLSKLFSADENLRKLYEPFVDIVYTKNGISFVPKGCSKASAIEKFCIEQKIDTSSLLIQGNCYSDFFKGISLESAMQKKKKASYNFQKFDLEDYIKALDSEIKTIEKVKIEDNFQTYFMFPNKIPPKKALNKFAELEAQANKDRLFKLKESVLEQQTQVLKTKCARDLENLEKNIAKILESGEENPEFSKKADEIVSNYNKQISEVEKNVQNISLDKKYIFNKISLQGSNSLLHSKWETLSQKQLARIKQEKESEALNLVYSSNKSPKNVQKTGPKLTF